MTGTGIEEVRSQRGRHFQRGRGRPSDLIGVSFLEKPSSGDISGSKDPLVVLPILESLGRDLVICDMTKDFGVLLGLFIQMIKIKSLFLGLRISLHY